MTFITLFSRRRKDTQKEKRKDEQEKRGSKSENVALQTEKREREKNTDTAKIAEKDGRTKCGMGTRECFFMPARKRNYTKSSRGRKSVSHRPTCQKSERT